MIEYRINNTSDKFDIAQCQESAESGYAPAQYQLGQCYEGGIGVQRNLAKAFRWYWMASDKSRPAQERLNKDSYQGQLAKWLKKAVNRSDFQEVDLAEIMCMLGSCHMHGWGVDRDMKLAVEWWRKAAELGNAYANDCLGYCYSTGQGDLPKDIEQAFAHYMKAAEGEYAGAYFTLGLCYSEGNGVVQNDEKAFLWFKKAAENNNPMAWIELAKCYYAGRGVSVDYDRAVEWYRKAIDTDGYVSPDALRGLGDCYSSGRGVEQDWEKAVEFYREAAKKSDPEAQYLLARCYAEGNGVGQDMAEAVKLYKKAATNICENKKYYGHVGAMRCLGDCYANGTGVRKNAKQASAWYAKAEELEAGLKNFDNSDI